jgi:hypothetical protein
MNTRLRQIFSYSCSFRLYKSLGLNVFFKQFKSVPVRHKAGYLCGSVLDSNAWGHGIEFFSSQKLFLSFVQPLCCFVLYKELLCQCFVFYGGIDSPVASGASVDLPLTCLFVRHVSVTDCKKLK